MTKLSALPAATSVDGSEVVPLVQSGVTKKAALTVVKALILKTGSFTLSAAASTVVADTSTTSGCVVTLTPTNAAAATLMNGTKSLYISAKSAGVSFTVATADGTAAVGTETFQYVLHP